MDLDWPIDGKMMRQYGFEPDDAAIQALNGAGLLNWYTLQKLTDDQLKGKVTALLLGTVDYKTIRRTHAMLFVYKHCED